MMIGIILINVSLKIILARQNKKHAMRGLVLIVITL